MYVILLIKKNLYFNETFPIHALQCMKNSILDKEVKYKDLANICTNKLKAYWNLQKNPVYKNNMDFSDEIIRGRLRQDLIFSTNILNKDLARAEEKQRDELEERLQ